MASSRFRKKPIVIEAEQVIFEEPPYPDGVRFDPETALWVIGTLEGIHVVTNYDWIITGVKGEKYPCKPDIFDMTYEAVDGEFEKA